VCEVERRKISQVIGLEVADGCSRNDHDLKSGYGILRVGVSVGLNLFFFPEYIKLNRIS
jgi:hypothetical protein